jgi:hypothetical protein
MTGYDQRGKNGDELGCFDFIPAIFGEISYEIHLRSAFTHHHPRLLLS